MPMNSFLEMIWKKQKASIENVADDMMVISYICQHCEEPGSAVIREADFYRWLDGAFVQDVWYDLTPEQREAITHCIHAECSEAFYDHQFDSMMRNDGRNKRNKPK